MQSDEFVELMNNAPTVAKAAASLVAAIPLTGIVKRMLGPAADELAEMWRDQIRIYRFERQTKCVSKASEMLKAANLATSEVPPKLLFPLLEGASMEGDENLHDMWAALLANAASPRKSLVRPSFLPILKEMSPDEAGLLQLIYEKCRINLEGSVQPDKRTPQEEPDRSTVRFDLWSDIRQELLDRFVAIPGETREEKVIRFEACALALQSNYLITHGPGYSLSGRGCSFLDACRPPEPDTELKKALRDAIRKLNGHELEAIGILFSEGTSKRDSFEWVAGVAQDIIRKTGDVLLVACATDHDDTDKNSYIINPTNRAVIKLLLKQIWHS
jgi:hypothetical protein